MFLPAFLFNSNNFAEQRSWWRYVSYTECYSSLYSAARLCESEAGTCWRRCGTLSAADWQARYANLAVNIALRSSIKSSSQSPASAIKKNRTDQFPERMSQNRPCLSFVLSEVSFVCLFLFNRHHFYCVQAGCLRSVLEYA